MRYRSEHRAKFLVLGLLMACGLMAVLAVAFITVNAVFLAPRPMGTLEPWVATGLADVATYQAAQTQASDSGLPTPTVVMPTPEPGELPVPSPAPGEPTGQIVYTCFVQFNDDVCLMNADGSNQRRLTTDSATDWYAALSPDGQFVSFSSRRTRNFEAFLIDTAGENVQQLTQSLGGIYAPEIAPDGTRVVLVSTANGKQDIYVLPLDGSAAQRITTNPADDIDPTWSPNGTQIAFTSNRTGTNEIYVINADGTDERQVTNGSNQREGGRVDWSPDGQWIGFYAGLPGAKDLFMIPASCVDAGPCGPDQMVRLTEGGNNKAPSFSPDSQWVAYASEAAGDNDIWIMRIDGSDRRRLTFETYAEWQPRWGP